MISIVLPIKPVYAERIYNGEKKYEFRKRLCRKSIGLIYLYETYPIMRVTGYVEVIGKIRDTVERLWSKTENYAGINCEEYKKYFSNTNIASAYVLGSSNKFGEAKNLQSFKLNYVPQSFSYVDCDLR